MKKNILFIVMSVLILMVGTPLVLKQNWKQFSMFRQNFHPAGAG
jgi:hypothetical protein